MIQIMSCTFKGFFFFWGGGVGWGDFSMILLKILLCDKFCKHIS